MRPYEREHCYDARPQYLSPITISRIYAGDVAKV